jgi:hypothetical protein
VLRLALLLLLLLLRAVPVVRPVAVLLLIDVSNTPSVPHGAAKLGPLQQPQKVERMRESHVLRVLGAVPVLQVGQVGHKGIVVEKLVLRKICWGAVELQRGGDEQLCPPKSTRGKHIEKKENLHPR